MKFDFTSPEYNAFVATLPEDIRQEYFQHLGTTYCVPEALFIISKLNLETSDINVEEWAKGLGMAGKRKSGIYAVNLLTGVADDDVFKDNINPSVPLIIVEHSFKDGRKKVTTALLIDGNKRLRRAFLEGTKELKGYYLPERLAKLIKG